MGRRRQPGGGSCCRALYTTLNPKVWQCRRFLPSLPLLLLVFLLLGHTLPHARASLEAFQSATPPSSRSTVHARRSSLLDAARSCLPPNFIRHPHHKDVDHPQHWHKPQAQFGFAWSCAASPRAQSKGGSPPPCFFVVLFLSAFRPCQSPTADLLTYMHPHPPHTDACPQ